VVAALPFASPGVFVSCLELAESDTRGHTLYAERFREAVDHLAKAFRGDTINLFMAHTHLNGAKFGSSERSVHLGDDWAAETQAFPATTQYVALGHIHNPQAVTGSAPTRYAGSLLQLDFGEVGQQKSFVVLEARPGLPVRTELIPYEGGTTLHDVRVKHDELASRTEEIKRLGWVRLIVELDEPDPDLNGKVRRLMPNVVSVRSETPRVNQVEEETIRITGKRPIELYRDYFNREYGKPPDEEVEAAFNELYLKHIGD
jgi:exonuclease SbcD